MPHAPRAAERARMVLWRKTEVGFMWVCLVRKVGNILLWMFILSIAWVLCKIALVLTVADERHKTGFLYAGFVKTRGGFFDKPEVLVFAFV